MRLNRFTGFFLGYGWLWGRRKLKAKYAAKKRRQQKLQKPPAVSGQGEVRVVRIFPKASSGHAWLKRTGGGGEVFLDLKVAKASGFKNLQVGQVFEASWGKSRRKKRRLDVVTLSN